MYLSNVIVKGCEYLRCALRGTAIFGKQEGLATPRALVGHRLVLGPIGLHETRLFIQLHNFASLRREYFEEFASAANLVVSDPRLNAKAGISLIAISDVWRRA
jgi:hypothetical protein